MKTAQFKPIGVTLETIDFLTKRQEMDAIALYMSYTAITQWQETPKIWATKSFMLKRTGWGETRIQKAKNKLKEYNLIEDIKGKNKKDGSFGKNYIKINHVVGETFTTTPVDQGSGETSGCETTPPSAFNSQESAFNLHKDSLSKDKESKAQDQKEIKTNASNNNLSKTIQEPEIIECVDQGIPIDEDHHSNSKKKKRRTTNSKRQRKALAPVTQEARDVNIIIGMFRNNGLGDWIYKDVKERGAIKYLIKRMGFEKTKKSVQFALSLIGRDYAPQITTPSELKYKFNKLLAYWSKQNSTDNKGAVEI